MNKIGDADAPAISSYQLRQFQELVMGLFQCCQERMQYQSERFGLPDAELRCLLLFGSQRYLTPKSIARMLNVTKSRVTKLVDGLITRGLVQRVKDPEDSRVYLLSLTPSGQEIWTRVTAFMEQVNREVLSRMPEAGRQNLLSSLILLKESMEAVKEMME